MAALAQVPQMQRVTVLAAEQQIGLHSIFDHFRRAPFAGDRNVVAEMPPEVVGQVLRSAVDLPAAEHVDALMVEQKESAGTVAVGSTQRAHIDRVGAAMNRMRPAVTGARGEFFGFDRLDDLRVARIGFRINHVDARRTQPGHDQVTALDVRMRRVGAKRCAARVPAEMVQFVAGARHFELSDDLAVGRGLRVDVEHAHRIVARISRRLIPGGGVERSYVREPFARRLHRHPRGRIKRLVGLPKCHALTSAQPELGATLCSVRDQRQLNRAECPVQARHSISAAGRLLSCKHGRKWRKSYNRSD